MPGSDFSDGFNIRKIKDLLGGKTLNHDLHRHDFYFILAVEKGSGIHEIDFTSYKITDHSVFFIRPGQVHQLALEAGSSGYLLEFIPEFYYSRDRRSIQLLNRASGKNFCQLNPERSKKLFSVLGDIFTEYLGKQETYLEVIKAGMTIFFIELLRHRQNLTGTLRSSAPYEQETLETLIRLIEANLTTHKQASYYSDRLNLSPYQLNAITKSTLGKTCSEIINEFIILEAKRQLLATANQVTQIADHLGYGDVSYFIRFFKKHTGYSPDAFRQHSG